MKFSNANMTCSKRQCDCCPSLEEVWAFAKAPPSVEGVHLATHIFFCKACSLELALINEILLMPKKRANDFDKISDHKVNRAIVHNFLQQKKQEKKKWNTIKDYIDKLPPSEKQVSLPSSLLGAAQSEVQPPRSGAANSLVIRFSATCQSSCPDYWRAEITIPPAPLQNTVLSVRVVDRNGDFLAKGKLLLAKMELPIEKGVARMELGQFQKNLSPPIVRFIFPDGRIVDGILELF